MILLVCECIWALRTARIDENDKYFVFVSVLQVFKTGVRVTVCQEFQVAAAGLEDSHHHTHRGKYEVKSSSRILK